MRSPICRTDDREFFPNASSGNLGIASSLEHLQLEEGRFLRPVALHHWRPLFADDNSDLQKPSWPPSIAARFYPGGIHSPQYELSSNFPEAKQYKILCNPVWSERRLLHNSTETIRRLRLFFRSTVDITHSVQHYRNPKKHF